MCEGGQAWPCTFLRIVEVLLKWCLPGWGAFRNIPPPPAAESFPWRARVYFMPADGVQTSRLDNCTHVPYAFMS